MTQPRLHHLSCPDAQRGHRMAWWQWGEADSEQVVVCVHGLTRQGRDFDVLAQALVEHAARQGRRLAVVCPDIAGRGKSDWLPDPMAYQVPTYAADMMQLLRELAGQVRGRVFDWVGTSMGGLIGMGVLGTLAQTKAAHAALATEADGLPRLRRLVLNDVGPALQWQALQRIASYVGVPGLQFTTLEEGAAYLRSVSPGFGPCTEAQWLALSQPMLVQADNGTWRLHYDPAIAQAFRLLTPEITAQTEAVLWALYDRIDNPTLVLRGADSDLLSAEVAQAMASRGPRAQVIAFEGVGHAPTLVSADQVGAVSRFLLDD
ncbi:MAG: 2-succinyl-6-hydroxy-2,4-cyclohexadiene-1-carboxylate synthase [Paracidovorax wautersii]|uniref:2-succinyl-6-hydroxy-2, 4-cyclohexadiene-1-carboxylate synthase n=1 Tax=Paracidovorax wautersii TaxID=1177982 RepID=A0A7V8FLL8_9BURK|nr:MAG: 2-succinyl-6-hydroxy-2,4-cyclohexadiene-1-carboxylate synthase [Paracidovorax wautersii]